MIIELIIVILGMLGATALGFYFGYLKREGVPPVMPSISIRDIGDALKLKKDKQEEPKGFYD